METITNIASTATEKVSTLIYGEGQNNETAGKEPVSGQQGEGTATDPYDHGNLPTPMQPAFVDKSPTEATAPAAAGGNDFLKLNPVVNEQKKDDDAPKADVNLEASQTPGMTVLPLTDTATEGVKAPTSPTTGAAATEKIEAPATEKPAGVTPGAVDFGASPPAPASADVKTADLAVPVEKPQPASGDVSPRTSAPPSVAANDKEAEKDTMTPAQKRISMLSKNPFSDKDKEKEKSSGESKTASDKKANRLSLFKGKLKDKLHIGSSKEGSKEGSK